MTTPDDLARLRANLADELDGAALYEALAGVERDPERSAVFARLAQAERAHAAFWQERLRAAGAAVPAHAPSARTRLLIRLARWFGPAFVLPSVTSAEFAGRNRYAGQADALAAGLSAEEHGHAAVLRSVAARGGLSGTQIAGAEVGS